jgi:hypothetical protein
VFAIALDGEGTLDRQLDDGGSCLLRIDLPVDQQPRPQPWGSLVGKRHRGHVSPACGISGGRDFAVTDLFETADLRIMRMAMAVNALGLPAVALPADPSSGKPGQSPDSGSFEALVSL